MGPLEHSLFKFDHKNISLVILPLPLIQEEHRKNKLGTGNFPLGGLSVNSAKITDRSDMTSSVYHGRKAKIKQTEETMKTDIAAPPLILHWTYDNYLSAVVKFL